MEDDSTVTPKVGKFAGELSPIDWPKVGKFSNSSDCVSFII